MLICLAFQVQIICRYIAAEKLQSVHRVRFLLIILTSLRALSASPTRENFHFVLWVSFAEFPSSLSAIRDLELVSNVERNPSASNRI